MKRTMETVRIAAAQTIEFREDIEAAPNCAADVARAPRLKARRPRVFRKAAAREIGAGEIRDFSGLTVVVLRRKSSMARFRRPKTQRAT